MENDREEKRKCGKITVGITFKSFDKILLDNYDFLDKSYSALFLSLLHGLCGKGVGKWKTMVRVEK